MNLTSVAVMSPFTITARRRDDKCLGKSSSLSFVPAAFQTVNPSVGEDFTTTLATSADREMAPSSPSPRQLPRTLAASGCRLRTLEANHQSHVSSLLCVASTVGRDKHSRNTTPVGSFRYQDDRNLHARSQTQREGTAESVGQDVRDARTRRRCDRGVAK